MTIESVTQVAVDFCSTNYPDLKPLFDERFPKFLSRATVTIDTLLETVGVLASSDEELVRMMAELLEQRLRDLTAGK